MNGGEVTDLGERATQEIERLERRLRRERTARLAAEEIAEEQTRRLWALAGQLERQVQERTAELVDARAAAARADEAKTVFLARLGHVTLSPIHVASGLLELVARGASPAERDRIALIGQTLSDIHRLFRNLHVVADADAGSLRLDVQPVAVLDCIERAVATVRTPALRRGVFVVAETPGREPPVIETDPLRLVHLLEELLGAAVTAVRPGRLVVLVDDAGDGTRIMIPTPGADPATPIATAVWDGDETDLGPAAVERLAGALGATVRTDGDGVVVHLPSRAG